MTVASPPAAGLAHVYQPRGTAKILMECRDTDILVSGPAGTGKSRACLEKMLLLALLNGNRDRQGLEIPGKTAFAGLICRKVQKSLSGTTLETWRKFVAVEAIKAGVCWYYGGSSSEPPAYRFANGSTIAITGLDNVEKIMSSEFDTVYVGEATDLTMKDWEFITVRLRNGAVSFQQVIADCNPNVPTHWLKKRTIDGKTKILFSEHWENPRYFDEVPSGTQPVPAAGDVPERKVEQHEGKTYRMTAAGAQYLAKLDALTGVRRERLFLGKWVAADGLVFENWNPAVSVLPNRFVIPLEWPRFWSIDFGFTNPFVCQWWAEDPDGRAYLYREIYWSRRLVEDHARHILREVTKGRPGLTAVERKLLASDRSLAVKEGLCEWKEPMPEAIICDHDAEGRETLKKYLDLLTTPAVKTVKNGIQAVDARLKVAGDGKPRLLLLPEVLVARDAVLEGAGLPVCTQEEIGGYVWAPPKPGQAPKEEPLKENDHGCDAMRYFVAHRDLRFRIRDREIGLEG